MILENAWALTPDGQRVAHDVFSRGVRTGDGDPGYAERNQTWFDALSQHNKDGWPAERKRMLDSAQRAEVARDNMLIDPSK